MKLELADIATDEKRELKGFKILFIFKFYISYVKTKTHIKLCKIRTQIQELTKGREPILDDFHDPILQEKLLPLINEYCVIGLLNERKFSWIFKYFIRKKIEDCGNYHIWNIYFTLYKMNEPAFF